MLLRMLAENADERGEEVWVASLDLEKAFDMVYNASVIAALDDAKVDSDIMRYLVCLYQQQVSYISLDNSKSRLISILRGVRQGDPLSPLLFNNVTLGIFKDLKKNWANKRRGTDVCGSEMRKSTHAMFADDATLVASSRQQLVAMIKDVKEALTKHGLKLNLEKCCVQTTNERLCRQRRYAFA